MVACQRFVREAIGGARNYCASVSEDQKNQFEVLGARVAAGAGDCASMISSAAIFARRVRTRAS